MSQKLIDADVLIREIIRAEQEAESETKSTQGNIILARALALSLIKCITDLPTIDAVPVLRCKDCKRCNGFQYPDIQLGEIGICKIDMTEVNPDDFCSRGIRRADND